MMILSLFGASVMSLLKIELINEAFDVYIVPSYIFCNLLFCLYFAWRLSKSTEVDIDNRKFVFKKTSSLDNMTWRQKLFGAWEKYERKGMAEFLAFNGAPHILARSLAAGAFVQHIEHMPGDETVVRARATGIPAVDGAFLQTAESEEAAQLVSYVDRGKPYNVKMWWDETTKQLELRFIDKNGWLGSYYWKLLDDHTMYMHGHMVRQNGEEVTFETHLKRINA